MSKKSKNRFDALREKVPTPMPTYEPSSDAPKRTAFAESYHQKLKDPRWQKRRLEIMSAANWKCEECDGAGSTLSVHHSHYIKGLEPWEYPASLLHCVCESCHLERQDIEESTKIELMKFLRFVPTVRVKKMFWFIMAKAMAEGDR